MPRTDGLPVTGPLVTGICGRIVENRIRMRRAHGSGNVARSIRRLILRLDTDAGISGFGPCSQGP